MLISFLKNPHELFNKKTQSRRFTLIICVVADRFLLEVILSILIVCSKETIKYFFRLWISQGFLKKNKIQKYEIHFLCETISSNHYCVVYRCNCSTAPYDCNRVRSSPCGGGVYKKAMQFECNLSFRTLHSFFLVHWCWSFHYETFSYGCYYCFFFRSHFEQNS